MKLLSRFSFMLLLAVAVAACKKKENTSTNQPKDTPKITDSVKAMKADMFTSFDVPLSLTPFSIPKICTTSYRVPYSAFGMVPHVDFRVNDDNTLDAYWLDESEKAHISRISMTSKSLIEDVVIPSYIMDTAQKFLGFEKIGNDKYLIGYSCANSFGQKKAEAWFTEFTKDGHVLFATRIFGEINLDSPNSKADPAQAGSCVMRYNAATNVIAIYTAHTELLSGARHQASWLGFLDANTGKVLMNGTKHIGAGWYVSHNLDQRAFYSAANKLYTLAHGDTYPRSLCVAAWNSVSGQEFSLEYHKILSGNPGGSSTETSTGDFAELTNKKVAIAFSTLDDRTTRDLKLSLVSGMDVDAPVVEKEVWVTNLGTDMVGWGSKVIQYGDNCILLGWNTFADKKGTGSHFQLVDLKGEKFYPPYDMSETVLYPNQSFRYSLDKKSIIYVTTVNNSLRVTQIKIDPTY